VIRIEAPAKFLELLGKVDEGIIVHTKLVYNERLSGNLAYYLACPLGSTVVYVRVTVLKDEVDEFQKKLAKNDIIIDLGEGAIED
jgi:hypothetical protein